MAWNRPNETVKAKKNAKRTKRIITSSFCVVTVAFVCVFAWFLFGPHEQQHDQLTERRGRQIRDVGKKTQERTAHSAPKTLEEAKAAFDEHRKVAVSAAKYDRPISDEEFAKLTNRVFTTTTEQLLSWIVCTRLGDMPMPMPPIDEEERKNLVGILISKNPAKADDSDEVIAAKEAVMAAKDELLRYLKEGGDPDDFLQYYNEELMKAFDLRSMAHREAEKVFLEDPDLGRDFVNKMNEKFEADGIKPLVCEDYE